MIAFVFPGQGAQKVGMGQSLASAFPVCRDVFAAADAALGESLSTMCFEGPAESLQMTENTQPAILAMAAKKKEIRKVAPSQSAEPTQRILNVHFPQKAKQTQMVSGSPTEAARELVKHLREDARVIQQ